MEHREAERKNSMLTIALIISILVLLCGLALSVLNTIDLVRMSPSLKEQISWITYSVTTLSLTIGVLLVICVMCLIELLQK